MMFHFYLIFIMIINKMYNNNDYEKLVIKGSTRF